MTKWWFPGCYYAGADIQDYNIDADDKAAMDQFYLVGVNGSGYEAIPDSSFDIVILSHVVEHMSDPLPILAKLCEKLKPGGFIWVAFPSLRSLSLPSAEGTLHFCDDPTHVRVPDIREIANVLLKHQVVIVHAGRSHDYFLRMLRDWLVLPFKLANWLIRGKLIARGLWFIVGFEDHVFGQRKTDRCVEGLEI